MDSVGEGEGGKIWENGIETCKISCMKRVASPGSMHDIWKFFFSNEQTDAQIVRESLNHKDKFGKF